MNQSPQHSPEEIEWLTVGPEAAALLTHLHRQAFSDTTRDLWSESDFAQILALPTTLAMIALVQTSTDDKTPAGFVVIAQVLDECEILTLGVAPQNRKAGIGHHLVGAVIERAGKTGGTCIFLEVREDNQAALRLYERHGFVLAGRRKGYYQLNDGQRVAAVIMRRNIA